MYRSLISLMPKTVPPLLDLFPNAAVAYSLRKLRTAYNGNCIRVRRSSDNTEQDIGFSGGLLDVTTLLSFVGAENGFVTTWYDQSGNNRNATQTTAGNQPRIVNGGVIDLKGLKPSLRFDGSNDFLTRNAISALNPGNNYSIFSVSSNEIPENFGDIINTSNTTTQRLVVANDRRTTGGIYRNLSITNNSNTIFGVDLSAANGSANQRLLSGFINSFNMSAFDDGNIGSTNTYSGTYTNNVLDIGAFRNIPRYLNGNVQEIIIYPTDQSANRLGIEQNINTHYNIY
jgi:hypothetical protein